VKPADVAVALDHEARGPVILADDRDFDGQRGMCFSQCLVNTTSSAPSLKPATSTLPLLPTVRTTSGGLHVMHVKALLDNRRQEPLEAFVDLTLSHRVGSRRCPLGQCRAAEVFDLMSNNVPEGSPSTGQRASDRADLAQPSSSPKQGRLVGKPRVAPTPLMNSRRFIAKPNSADGILAVQAGTL